MVSLQEIHKWIGNFDQFSKYDDQNTLPIKSFANYKLKFKDVYIDFIRNVISEIVPYDFYYQKIPTLRVGLPEINLSENFIRIHITITKITK